MITLRAVLAIVLLVGVYLLALVGVAVAGLLMVLAAQSTQDYVQGELTTFNFQIVLLLFGSVVTLVAVIGGLFRVGQAGSDTGSVLVDEEDAPELWTFVKQVAAEAGIRPPDELRLTGEVNASVSEDARLLGLLPGRRRLHLGLPLLATLSANELRALLGHEFGHYIGWHTRVGVVVHRGYLALDRLQNNLIEAGTAFRWGPAGLLSYAFAGYIRLYARISFAVRRRQEFEADAVAARIAGPRAVAQALRSLAAIDASWHAYVQNYLLRTAAAGYAPEDPLAMFVAMLSDAPVRAVDPGPEPRNPYASHPSTADRLARLAGMDVDVPTRLPEPTPSTWRYPRREVVEHLLPDREVETLPSAQWLDKAAHQAAPTASARTLLAAAGSGATLATVLDTLEAGEAARLAVRFDPDDRHRAMARLCEALHALVGHYLVEAGSAHWRLSWTGPSELVVSELRADGVHVLPFAELNGLVFEAVDHRSGVDRLRLHLASLRVDPRRPFASETEQSTSVVFDTEPLRRDRARRTRVIALYGAAVIAIVAVSVIADGSNEDPPRNITTVLPTYTAPTTHYRLPTSLFPYPTLPRPTFDISIIPAPPLLTPTNGNP
ncbi:M48 family metallopeptidase [Kutzneria kofuensis]|uniref:Zn-dependent protease with chaperone function n=1 Tax=Kutzneria kofuensis TaxID=103725 RepID=A0A7W9KFN4_9PSEU|nr:M48 family metallopeptidase [Kutzneria kofuensis]MBB5891273.1 Zn-dependent protease with chaperone function [Kutzneria kofuensis]